MCLGNMPPHRPDPPRALGAVSGNAPTVQATIPAQHLDAGNLPELPPPPRIDPREDLFGGLEGRDDLFRDDLFDEFWGRFRNMPVTF